MKRILSFMTVFALLLTACEGDPGPPGPPGFDGQDGVNIVGQAFEIVLDFTPGSRQWPGRMATITANRIL